MWESAERVQKNQDGEFRALINGKWVPAEKAQKNPETGEYRVILSKGKSKQKVSLSPEQIREHQEKSAISLTRGEHPILAKAADMAAGFTNTARGAMNLVGETYGLGENIGEKVYPTTGTDESILGLLADPLPWLVGGGVSKTIPYAKVMGKGVVEGGKALLKNMTSGAVTGGAIGGLSDEGDAATGAGIGAAANVILPPIAGLSVSVSGKIYDILAGRFGKVKAAEIFKQAAGGDIEAIKAVTAVAPDNLNAAQATSGINRDTWDALTEFARRNDPDSFYSRSDVLNKQTQIDEISNIAGGRNQTEARLSADKTKEYLNLITNPMRETVFDAANTAGTVGKRLQSDVDTLGNAASNSVADVRRLERAGQIAEETGQSGKMRLDSGAPPIAGLPRVPGRYSYGHELAELAESFSQKSADDSLIYGQARRFRQMQLDSIAEHGLKPLSSTSIINNLNSKILDPKIGSEIMKEKVLTLVRERLSKWTDADGIIDVAALYGIRKSAVNDAIEQLIGSSDPKSKARAAAGILKEVKPLIDNAITKASGGGPEWVNYLKTFSDGMHQISRQKIGAKMLSLLETSPKKFESLAFGNEPKMVEKIFDNSYDLYESMGSKNEQSILKVANELLRDRKIKEGAVRGGEAFASILSENIQKFILPNWINREVAVINRGLKESEVRINKDILKNIIEGAKTGKSANELLFYLPTEKRMAVINELTKRYGTAGIVTMQGGQ